MDLTRRQTVALTHKQQVPQLHLVAQTRRQAVDLTRKQRVLQLHLVAQTHNAIQIVVVV